MMRHHQHHHYLPMLFVSFIITTLLVTACSDRPKTYTVGVVNLALGLDIAMEGFKEGMAELGYTEGENITSYGMDQTISGKQAARLADQIFKGPNQSIYR